MNPLRQMAALLQVLRPRVQAAGAFLAAVVFLAGSVIRLRLYLAGRSLWHDEATLAFNVVQRPLPGLFSPLDFHQVSPVGFLMLAKAAVSALGNTEYALRLVPLLAGLAALPLTWVLARRWSRGVTPLLSLCLAALAPGLIYYSSEFKQYSTDALAALILLLAATSCLQVGAKPASLVRLAVGCTVLPWISHPAMFVAGGVLFTLALTSAVRRDWARLRYVLTIGLILALNLGLIYVTSMRETLQDHGLAEFWAGSFPPSLSYAWQSWFQGALSLLIAPLPTPGLTVVCALFAVGLISLSFRRWEWMTLAVAPLVLMFAASALGLYPIAERLLLFSIPVVLIVTADGVERLRQFTVRLDRRIGAVVVAALALFLLVQPAQAGLQEWKSPPMRDHISLALAHIRERSLPSDVVYLYYFAIPQFDYYAPLYGLDRHARVDGVMSRRRPGKYRRQVESLAGTERIWFIFVHNYREGKFDEQQYFLQQLDRFGTRLDEFYSPGTTVFLYDLSIPPRP